MNLQWGRHATATVIVTGMVLIAVQAFRTVEQPVAIDLATWPESVELEPGQQAQFYAATLYEDGTTGCDMATASADPAVFYNKADWPGACDSALARLALPQDQPPFLRFTWNAQPDSVVAAYDSIHYHLLVRNMTLGTSYVFDTLTVHPDTSFDWHDGVGDADYWAAVYVQGFGRDSVFASARSDSTVFGYPHPDSLYGPLPPLPTLLTPSPVRVDTVSGGG